MLVTYEDIAGIKMQEVRVGRYQSPCAQAVNLNQQSDGSYAVPERIQHKDTVYTSLNQEAHPSTHVYASITY